MDDRSRLPQAKFGGQVASVLSLTLLYIAIARSVSDVPAHRSAVLWHAVVAISERGSFASLGMTHGRLFVGQYTRTREERSGRCEKALKRNSWQS